MARYIKPLCKICRKYGEKLYLKGKRCETDKCPLDPRRKKIRIIRRKETSEYGRQLREKNKVKIFYGVLERQFKRYFEMAKKMKGTTGEILLQLLERRLDNVVYKLNFAHSRRMARQIVSHGGILVNGKKVDRPGYLVEVGDVISVKPNSRHEKLVRKCLEEREDKLIPAWLALDKEKLEGRVLRFPTREEVSIQVDEQLIVNYYSK
ncbi:MAG TPA: 30S ribosomal protein S4 [Firmicutes bacterium]|nr:MAG: 30S ribosomal protein S4 [Candidatus Omnitrophota bacterium]HDD64943.1 30S ribosomal protein S4 [Bacillota bacterium]